VVVETKLSTEIAGGLLYVDAVERLACNSRSRFHVGPCAFVHSYVGEGGSVITCPLMISIVRNSSCCRTWIACPSACTPS
jgi:hypothetical protein